MYCVECGREEERCRCHRLDEWQKQNLSKYKWTRGGIEMVKEDIQRIKVAIRILYGTVMVNDKYLAMLETSKLWGGSYED